MDISTIKTLNQEQLFLQETLLDIAGAGSEFEQQILFNALLERAKELKCYMQLKMAIRAFKEDLRAQMRGVGVNNITDFGYPYGQELRCGAWVANNNGVYMLVGYMEQFACYHPILPVERLRNVENKTEKIRIAFKRGEEWEEITVDKSVIASASKIVTLAQFGVAVTSETAKHLVRFLADLENFNSIPVRNSTSKLGWIGKDFIPYDKNVTFDSVHQFRELIEAIDECGSYETCLDTVRKIRANRQHFEPQLYMAASFASVLVKPLNMLPFIVNLWGSTGKGKTVALMMAASIWGNPAEGKYITDSYATQNAFEIRLDILNNLPLLMDDLSKVRDKLNENFTDLIYLLCSGKGKDRSNVDLGLNKVKTWSNAILSNMERPLATDTMRGGAINRILDFQMSEGYIFEDGNAVVEIVRENYGFAGRDFINYVREIGEAQIGEIRKDFERQIKEEAARQNSVKEEKQIMPLSLILTADKLFTDHIMQDGIYLDLAFCVAQLKDQGEVSEGRRAYDAVIDLVNMHAGKFIPNNFGEYAGGEEWGFMQAGYVNINPAVVKKWSKSENFSIKALCEWLKSKQLLKCNDKNQNIIRLDGRIKRFYTIKLPEREEHNDGFMEIPEGAEKELPFD